MAGKKYALEDFKLGESVILSAQRDLIFVVIDIDKEKGMVICGIPGMPQVHGRFGPWELEKEITPEASL